MVGSFSLNMFGMNVLGSSNTNCYLSVKGRKTIDTNLFHIRWLIIEMMNEVFFGEIVW